MTNPAPTAPPQLELADKLDWIVGYHTSIGYDARNAIAKAAIALRSAAPAQAPIETLVERIASFVDPYCPGQKVGDAIRKNFGGATP